MELFKIASVALFALPVYAQVPLSPAPDPEWKTAIRRAQELHHDGKFASAATSARRALEVAKRFGPSDDQLAGSYFLLGSINRDWGHCKESRNNYAHAIAVWNKQAHPNTSYLFNAMLSMIVSAGECDELDVANKLYRTYGSDLQRYRSNSLDEARLLSLQATLARSQKDYPQSEALLRKALGLLEQAPDASAFEIALLRNNLAVIIHKRGRIQESLMESEQTIAFFDGSRMRHPSMVAALNNAACSLADLGRSQEAQRMFERALEAARNLYGEDNLVTAKIMMSYASVLRQNHEIPAADAMKKNGSDVMRRSALRDHSTIDVEEFRLKP